MTSDVLPSEGSESRKLLLLGCSRRKRSDPGLLPAIDRYDGPAFRVVRRFLRQHKDPALSIFVLSAEFGLIHHRRPIPDYDRQMTAVRARELQPGVVSDLQRLVRDGAGQELFVLAGKTYRSLMQESLTQEWARASAGPACIRIASGPMGRKLSDLHDWLHGGPPAVQVGTNRAPGGIARLRGVAVEAATDQILELARRAQADERAQALRYQSWYVPLGGGRVAPKWLAAQLTGLPLDRFGTTEALRLLRRLGVPVLRV